MREVVGKGHASERSGPAKQPLSALGIGNAEDGSAIAQRQQDGTERFCQDADSAACKIKRPAWERSSRTKADTGGGDREQQMASRVSQNTGAPGERAEKKQPDRARKNIDVQGSEKGDLAEPERQHVEEAARRVDAMRLSESCPSAAVPGHNPGGGKACIARYSPRDASAATANSQRGPNRNGRTMNSASAYSVRMSPFQIRQRWMSPNASNTRAGARAAPFGARSWPAAELDGKACAEQQRKQRKCLQIDGQHQGRFDGAVDRRRRRPGEKNRSKTKREIQSRR